MSRITAITIVLLIIYLTICKSEESSDKVSPSKGRHAKKPHPVPFSRFLRTSEQRNELSRIIKDARSSGASRKEVSQKIDVFLRAHLDADDMREVEKLREEGTRMNQK